MKNLHLYQIDLGLLRENPEIKPAFEATSIILVSTSITNKNSKGDKGSPCCKPLDTERNLSENH